MMALKLLPILQVIIILCSPTYSYPTIYGTKRYGRLQRSNNPTWSTSHVQPYVRTQRYPVNYYEMYPYNQNYADDYYYPHDGINYPVYYPPARTSKYEVYQAVLPYYYDRPLMRNGFGGYYGYDDADPVDLEEEMVQEAEREQREEAQPIGQEMYYENDSSNSNNDNFNDVNAAFLQNLIMTQMYKDSLDKDDNYNNYNENEDAYGKIDEYPPKQDYYHDDEDVLELKQLAKPYPTKPKSPSTEERLHWFQRGGGNKAAKNKNYYEGNSYSEKRSGDLKKGFFSDRKVGTKILSTTISPDATALPTKASRQGQKEEVLLRPATPVKHPFSNPVIAMINKKDRERTPSVYDTIKHMLDMEKSLENGSELKPVMRKRIISSEDSLTHQLTVLKKQ